MDTGGQSSLDLSHSHLHNQELYFLIAKFLSSGPCQRASEALLEELEKNEIIPKTVNWLGESFTQDFKTYSSKLNHVGPNHLPNILEHFLSTVNAKNVVGVSGFKSLLSVATKSLLCKPSSDSNIYTPSVLEAFSGKRGQPILPRPYREKTRFNFVQSMFGREISGCGVDQGLLKPGFYGKIKRACRTLGHLSAVYCVLFDMTGKYIFTGADDSLVKIWSAVDGRLIQTLRGTTSEITDLAVNHENTLLAVGSCDKLIRVWCLQTCEPIDVLSGHSGNVTAIFFCPIPRISKRSNTLFLASTSTDGSCAFWAYTEKPGCRARFQPNPTLYQERMRPGHAQMICASFSTGGMFMAAGSADNNVRVYYMLGPEGPLRILEVECHNERVDSISWSHRGLRFISGSKDGTALVWRYENQQWRYIRLHCSKMPPGEPAVLIDDPKRRPRVTMVAWNLDDSLVITAVSDLAIKIWNPKTGELVRVLKGHEDEAYVIEAHPVNPRIICTAGHDGKIILWDIGTASKDEVDPNAGKIIFEYHDKLEDGQGHGAVFDCKWSPDGFSLAATDSHGHLIIFNYGSNTKFAQLPKELFFHTDYRPVTRDAITLQILDEQTQVQPHLMPPPFLVDMEGNPYPPNLQRLVPGREFCREEQLIPNVAIAAGGQQEVIEGLPGVNPRSNIDQMIEQLAIQQGVPGEHRNGGRNSGGGERDRELRGVGQRRSGDVEGVRQSTGNWQIGNYGYHRRTIVQPLSQSLLYVSEQRRAAYGDEEEEYYQKHLQSCAPSGFPSGAHQLISPADSLAGRQIRSRRIRRQALQAAEERRQRELGEVNILNMRQLEGVAVPNPPQQEISVSQQSPRRPLPNSRRPNNRAQPRHRPLQFARDSEPENQEAPSSIESSSEAAISEMDTSSTTSEESDSDWGGRGGGTTRDHEHKTTSSKRRQRNTSVSPPHNGLAGEENGEPQPGPSSAITNSKTDPPKYPRKAKKLSPIVDDNVEEDLELFRPSEWLSEVMPKRSPYFPQLGDDLVYCKRGHQMYMKAVEDKSLYKISKKMYKFLPWVAHPDIQEEEAVRVCSVKFELEPPRLVCLKLSQTDWSTGELTGIYYYVTYHDISGQVDFLVLRQMYDRSLRHNWNDGDRFRCLIDRNWYLGTVLALETNPEFPNSKFLGYKTKWDNSDEDQLSPWDMEVIPDDFEIPPESEVARDGIPALAEDLRGGMYEVTPKDWPPHGHQDAQCTRISNIIEEVMHLAISEAFLTPVDLNVYPEYAKIVEYPIDLSTIKARLDNRFYRSELSLKFDIKYIAMNAEKFNQPESDIVKHARVVRDLCLSFVDNHELTDVSAKYHELMQNYKNDERNKQSRTKKRPRENQSASGISTRSSRHEAPTSPSNRSSRNARKNNYETKVSRKKVTHDSDESDESDRPWEERCKSLLERVWHMQDAVPFRAAVDEIQYPDYYQTIDTPMDLQSVKEDLSGGNYDSPLTFAKDMRLIFANSKQYNTNKKAQIYTMTIRLQNHFECQVKSILDDYKSKSRRKQGSKSATSTPTKSSRTTRSSKVDSSRGAGSNRSPRKNPVRSAATKNPYLAKHDISSDEEDDSPRRPVRDSRQGSPRRGSFVGSPQKRLITNRQNGHVNGHSPRNGHVAGPSRPSKPVRRLRISSGESYQNEARSSRSPSKRQASPPKRIQAGSSKRNGEVPKKRVAAKAESESSEDEFEDSEDVQMPHLKMADDDKKDMDYDCGEEYDSEEDIDDSNFLRRSTRVRTQVKRGRHDSDDGYSYSTRYRGRPATNYDESQDVVSDASTEVGNRNRLALSRRSGRRTSGPLSELPQSFTRRAKRTGPPVLKSEPEDSDEQTPDDDDDENDEENEEQEASDDENDDNYEDQPGPSSRLHSTRKKAKVPSKFSSRQRRKASSRPVYDDDGESNADEEDHDEIKPRSRRKKRNLSSDDEVHERKKRKTEPNRLTRGGHRPNYAETSDSEPNQQLNVSSRGRVRKSKPLVDY